MKYVIQKIPERNVDHLTRELGSADLIIVEDLTDKHATRTFVKSLIAAEGQSHVHLEDDVQLAPNFRERAERFIAGRQDELISFFTLRTICAHKRMLGSQFLMAQCFYIPAPMVDGLIEFAPGWLSAAERGETNSIQGRDPDVLVADYLRATRQHYTLHYPPLVQHLMGVSAIDPRRSKYRQSKIFNGG